ncbi:class I SAM-dependent methyltransferase [Streptomyces sp. DASNCL29]|uniref:class I SAM-dependent methyltransferase n=1 Tax=Streptomyces sp. DASNCL29 TaxID=2583819 RepID=UPI00110FE798|nr:class I SAM-dependent methyltransferase [Streptomyces sp. DASNCL29]TMU96530.1 class I SAM-dependent methyltransferase [Streptomyces sp. DASNCL29]
MTAFTQSWTDTFSSVYANQPLARLSWFNASPGLELIKRVIDGTLKPGQRLIDLGSGPGADAEFIQGDVVDVPLPDSSADVVTDSFVFHNMRDDARRRYADEVRRLLKPGGLFLLNSCSDKMVAGTGPRRITSENILTTFTADRFECVALYVYRNVPTRTKPDQLHWFGEFRAR